MNTAIAKLSVEPAIVVFAAVKKDKDAYVSPFCSA